MSTAKTLTALVLAAACTAGSVHAAPTAEAASITHQVRAVHPAQTAARLPDMGPLLGGVGLLVLLAALSSGGGSSQLADAVGGAPGAAPAPAPSRRPNPNEAVTIADVDAARSQIRGQINNYRNSRGLPSYWRSDKLNALAQDYAETMAARGKAGYHHSDLPYPENIHLVTNPLTECVRDWKASPGHNANMLSTGENYQGFGMARTPDGRWWTCVSLFASEDPS